MALPDETVRTLGGLATMEDLSRRHSPDLIRIFVDYGRIVRVRPGWFAVRDLPGDVVRACRVGGKLACVSALRFHGFSIGDDGRLHVAMPGRGKVRAAADLNSVVLHWSRAELSGDRIAVSIPQALAQAERCLALGIPPGADTL